MPTRRSPDQDPPLLLENPSSGITSSGSSWQRLRTIARKQPHHRAWPWRPTAPRDRRADPPPEMFAPRIYSYLPSLSVIGAITESCTFWNCPGREADTWANGNLPSAWGQGHSSGWSFSLTESVPRGPAMLGIALQFLQKESTERIAPEFSGTDDGSPASNKTSIGRRHL